MRFEGVLFFEAWIWKGFEAFEQTKQLFVRGYSGLRAG